MITTEEQNRLFPKKNLDIADHVKDTLDISWVNIFNSDFGYNGNGWDKNGWSNINVVRDIAKNCGYPYFTWKKSVYRVTDEGYFDLNIQTVSIK